MKKVLDFVQRFDLLPRYELLLAAASGGMDSMCLLDFLYENGYRVDKMEKITVLDEERDGQEAYEALDMAVYARKTFGMFTGKEVKVHLRFENHLVGAVLDRLGRDVILVPDGEDHFTVWTDVIVSPQFFAWLCGFQTAAKVIGPDDVVKQMAEHVKSIAEQYE